MKYNIVIDFKNFLFKDKITYLILDALIYDLLKRTNFNIAIRYLKFDKGNIQNNGLRSTALLRTWNKNDGSTYINKKRFINEYEKSYFCDVNSYRRVLTRKQLNNVEIPSIIGSDLANILKKYSNDEEWIDDIVEVVSELIDNAASHAEGDCLLDISFNDGIANHTDKEEKEYIAINISVINFSENRLFDGIQANLESKRYKQNDEVYSKVYEAYNNHKRFFDDIYDEDGFFMITSFQNRVTTRSLESGNSGTGLTRLIQNIIGRAKENLSYVLSGKTILIFDSEYLGTTKENKFIGFNEEKNYIEVRPSKHVINHSALYIPGTVYNLLLIKEKNDGK